MKCKSLPIVALLLLCMMSSLTCSAFAAETSSSAANAIQTDSFNKSELVSFVESAVAYANANGKEKALMEFSNKSGSFVKGELYIYAYDFKGTCLAHPFKPDWIGKDKSDYVDSNGVPVLKNLIEVAKSGKGFGYFIFPNPAHDNKDEFKIGYVMKVDNDWWLGSGVYISCN